MMRLFLGCGFERDRGEEGRMAGGLDQIYFFVRGKPSSAAIAGFSVGRIRCGAIPQIFF
jgi:hypothetical protein